MKNFGKIGVLLGGPSSEREISIKSGTAVYEALKSLGHDVECIDPRDSASIEKDILNKSIDIVFIALHGRFGEDGTIQRILQQMGIPYTGSGPEASKLAFNKKLSYEIFKKEAIPIPNYTVLGAASELPSDFTFPVVVKPNREGSSIGMSIVDEESQLKEALDEAFKYDSNVLVEEYITGEDITVGILDEEPLPIVRIKPKAQFYNFKAKYTAGMCDYEVPAIFSNELTDKVKSLALRAHRSLGCSSFSRVDMLLDEKSAEITVLELNTIPGLTASSLLPKAAKAKGIEFAQMCVNMIESANQEEGVVDGKTKKDKE